MTNRMALVPVEANEGSPFCWAGCGSLKDFLAASPSGGKVSMERLVKARTAVFYIRNDVLRPDDVEQITCAVISALGLEIEE